MQLTQLRPKRWLILRVLYSGEMGDAAPYGATLTLVFGLAMLLCGVLVNAHERRFERECHEAGGTVLKKDKRKKYKVKCGGETEWLYSVSYTFQTAEHQAIRGEADVTKEVWDGLQPGNALRIRYLPGEPERSRPDGYSPAQSAGALAIVGGVLMFLAVVFLGLAWRSALSYARLLRKGTLTCATVTETSRRMRQIGKASYPRITISYCFRLPDGGSAKGEEELREGGLASCLEATKPVGVLYVPADPSRSILFRAKWAKYFKGSSQTTLAQWACDNAVP